MTVMWMVVISGTFLPLTAVDMIHFIRLLLFTLIKIYFLWFSAGADITSCRRTNTSQSEVGYSVLRAHLFLYFKWMCEDCLSLCPLHTLCLRKNVTTFVFKITLSDVIWLCQFLTGTYQVWCFCCKFPKYVCQKLAKSGNVWLSYRRYEKGDIYSETKRSVVRVKDAGKTEMKAMDWQHWGREKGLSIVESK